MSQAKLKINIKTKQRLNKIKGTAVTQLKKSYKIRQAQKKIWKQNDSNINNQYM